MKRLLQNQKVRIDAHQRGAGENIGWDKSENDIHIDKTSLRKVNGKTIEVQIRIPINTEREISIQLPKGIPDPDEMVAIAENMMIKEIREALSNRTARREFINDLLNTLENYPTALSSITRAQNTVKRLAKHFGLPEKINRQLLDVVDGKFNSLTALYTLPTGNYYFQVDRNVIEAGQILNSIPLPPQSRQ